MDRSRAMIRILSVFAAWGLALSTATAGIPALYVHGDVSEDGDVPSGSKPAFHQMRLADAGNRGLSQFREAAMEVGIIFEEAHDAAITLSSELLGRFRVLVLGSNQRRFSAEEAEAVRAWVEAGGGLIAWSDSAFGGHYELVGMGNTLGLTSDNDVTQQFGMEFLRDNGAGVFTVRKFTEPHYLNRQRADGGIAFRGEGVSPVRVTAPARLLAPLQAGESNGTLRLNSEDGELRPDQDAALAIAEIGQGRVLGVFDRNTFWNAGEGTRLAEVDNREFAQRILLWVAGDERDPSSVKSETLHGSDPR